MPDDILFEILVNLSAHEIENVISFVNVSLRDKVRNSNELWKRLCEVTGKLNLEIENKCRYRDHYRSMPCVPVDYPTIAEALAGFSNISKPFTITILPGVHRHDTIDLCISSSKLPFISEHERYYESDIFGGQIYLNSQIVHVCIQAAFPDKLTALVSFTEDTMGKPLPETPCINLYTMENDEGLRNRGLFHLEVKHISLFHYARGNNIWVGNTVARVDGSNTLLTLNSCSLQSDSGRGAVATRGARLWMKECTVADCAATGVYIGDERTSTLIQRCDVIRCGFGTRCRDADKIEINDGQVVPPGHSGIYVEGTIGVIIDDCLVAGNSLTGLSVVRCGATALRNCNIIENGSVPVSIEEPADRYLVGLEHDLRNFIRGHVTDMGGNSLGIAVKYPKDLKTSREI
jgi:parallel beta-helix repeat protein